MSSFFKSMSRLLPSLREAKKKEEGGKKRGKKKGRETFLFRAGSSDISRTILLNLYIYEGLLEGRKERKRGRKKKEGGKRGKSLSMSR